MKSLNKYHIRLEFDDMYISNIKLPEYVQDNIKQNREYQINDFEITKDKIIIEFVDENDIKTFIENFNESDDLEVSVDNLKISIGKKQEQKTIEEDTQQVTTDTESSSDEEDEDKTKILKFYNTKKIKSIEPGRYYVDFNDKDYWIIAILDDNTREAIKHKGEYLFEQSIKSMSLVRKKR